MKSGKIIRIENDLIIIRIISDNSIIEIHRSNFTFVPNVGDSIEILKNDDETKINKKEIEELAKTKYGNLAGIAQQYLFYWRRGA